MLGLTSPEQPAGLKARAPGEWPLATVTVEGDMAAPWRVLGKCRVLGAKISPSRGSCRERRRPRMPRNSVLQELWKEWGGTCAKRAIAVGLQYLVALVEFEETIAFAR